MLYLRSVQRRILLGSSLLAFATVLLGQEAEDSRVWIDYAVEGTIQRMDNALAPNLREGMVFSAVYAVALDTDTGDLDETPERALYLDVIDHIELTIDLNHVLAYEAATGVGDRQVELQRSEGEAGQERDLYSILMPLEGEQIGEAGWQARWLQLWFYGPASEMLDTLAMQPPPEAFERGWWRLTFWDAENTESLLAEGPITAAGDAGEPLTPSEQIAQLESVVLDLSARLQSEQARNSELSSELARAQTRIEGLQKIVDVIVEERRILQEKYDLLLEEQQETPAALKEQVAELEADAALWADREIALKEENRILGEALALNEREYAKLADEVAQLTEELAAAVLNSSPSPEVTPSPRSAVEATVSKPVEIVPPTFAVAPETKPEAPSERRFRRPRKFRH
jgi:hypothetical protein